MTIALKRIYDEPTPRDGHRGLVDRLWPRGLSKEAARLDAWLRDAAPSDELRRWYHADRSAWGTFRKRYLAELKEHRDALRPLARRAREGRVTLLFSSNDEKRNNAVVLKQYLEMLAR